MKIISHFLIVAGLLLSLNLFAFGEDAGGLFRQGEEAFSRGEYEKAIEFYEKAIKVDPNYAQAYNNLGLAYQAVNAKPSEIVWYFKTAVAIDPNNAQAYDNLGKAYYGMGDFDKAEQYCKKALEINPRLGSANFSLGWVYLLGKGQSADAIYQFKKTLEYGKIPYAYFGLGLAYFMNGDNAMVLETITNLRSMDQDRLATQLENVVRGHKYIPNDAGPLIDVEPQAERQPGIIVKAQPEEAPVAGQPQDSTQSVDGVTKIRIRGTLFNIDEHERQQPSSAEESQESSGGQSEQESSDMTPTDYSPVKVQGSVTGTRTQRIRSLKAGSAGQ